MCRRVGVACGALTSGLTAGILLGSVIATAVNLHYGPAGVETHGWRMPFILGGVFGLFAVLLRRYLPETPVFEGLRTRRESSSELPIKSVLRGHLPAVAISMPVTWVLTAAIVVVILMTPTLIQKLYGIAPATALRANIAATLALTLSCIAVGALGDRFGAARVFLVGCLGLLASTYMLYLGLRGHAGLLLPMYACAGLFVGIIGAVPSIIVSLFPAPVRFIGLSFSYNVSYAVFGGATPPLIAALLRLSPLAPAHYVGLVAVIGVLGAFALLSWMEGEEGPCTGIRDVGQRALKFIHSIGSRRIVRCVSPATATTC
jgi:MFS family permease